MLAIGILGGGLAVVTLRNVIHSAVAMMICFGSLAGMYALLGAPIIAAAQVLIYLGAISVLILFAIMLTQEKVGSNRLTFQTQAAPAAIAAIIVAVLVAVAVAGTNWGAASAAVRIATNDLAHLLFDRYVLAFEAVSVLLLAAVIGGVFLAKREKDATG